MQKNAAGTVQDRPEVAQLDIYHAQVTFRNSFGGAPRTRLTCKPDEDSVEIGESAQICRINLPVALNATAKSFETHRRKLTTPLRCRLYAVLRQNSMRTENSAIPYRDGRPIQVIPSPSNAKNLSRRPRAVIPVYKDGGTWTFSRRCVGSD
jgi:hypothetical protein